MTWEWGPLNLHPKVSKVIIILSPIRERVMSCPASQAAMAPPKTPQPRTGWAIEEPGANGKVTATQIQWEVDPLPDDEVRARAARLVLSCYSRGS